VINEHDTGGCGGGGAGAVTVRAAFPAFPSLVATMLAVPAESAVTNPPWLTVATSGAELDQTMLRPVRTFPLASVSLAVACAVCPTRIDPALNVTATAATGGGETVNPIDPVFPSLDAAIVTVPAAIALTRPVVETVAIAVFDDVQPTVRPVSTLPDASFSVITTCIVAPTASVVELAESDTVSTGAGAGASTVNVEPPVCPSLLAMIDADPALTAVTVPLAETVATPGFALDQVTVRPVKTFPAASRRVAVA
jgi:hypothetical protein